MTSIAPCPAVGRPDPALAASLERTLKVALADVQFRCVLRGPHHGHEAPVPGTSGVFRWGCKP